MVGMRNGISEGILLLSKVGWSRWDSMPRYYLSKDKGARKHSEKGLYPEEIARTVSKLGVCLVCVRKNRESSMPVANRVHGRIVTMRWRAEVHSPDS